MIRIAKTFDFDAAHWLPFVPDGHKCRRMHGHTYRVDYGCEGQIGLEPTLAEYLANLVAVFGEARRVLRKDVGAELNPEYARLAEERCRVTLGLPLGGAA